MPGGELAMYLDELAEFARYAGVSALCRCSVTGELEVRRATLFYDFCFTVFAWSVRDSRASLIASLDRKDRLLVFRILSSEAPDGPLFSEAFRSAVAELGGTVGVKTMDDGAGITLSLPEGGTADA